MAIVLESKSAIATESNMISLTITKPAGVVEDDILVAFISAGGGLKTSVTPPGGWVQEILAQPAIGNPRLFVLYKVATASEPANYTFTYPATGGQSQGVILRHSGVDTVTPVDVSAFGTNNDVPEITNMPCPSVTTTRDGAHILLGSASQPTGTTGTLAPPAGFTEEEDNVFSPTALGVYRNTTNQSTLGPTGVNTITKTGFTGNARDGFATLALLPLLLPGSGGIMGDPGTLRPPRERVQRVQIPKGTKIRNPFRNIYEDEEGRM